MNRMLTVVLVAVALVAAAFWFMDFRDHRVAPTVEEPDLHDQEVAPTADEAAPMEELDSEADWRDLLSGDAEEDPFPAGDESVLDEIRQDMLEAARDIPRANEVEIDPIMILPELPELGEPIPDEDDEDEDEEPPFAARGPLPR